jgi:hypothetical protein
VWLARSRGRTEAGLDLRDALLDKVAGGLLESLTLGAGFLERDAL